MCTLLNGFKSFYRTLISILITNHLFPLLNGLLYGYFTLVILSNKYYCLLQIIVTQSYDSKEASIIILSEWLSSSNNP